MYRGYTTATPSDVLEQNSDAFLRWKIFVIVNHSSYFHHSAQIFDHDFTSCPLASHRIEISSEQNTLTKTLKSLESRHLIKTAKSVTSKSKKLYMLYELSE